jgi:hypothetical protein
MVALEIPSEAISIRPSRRQHIAPWTRIETANGLMRICRHQARLPIAGGYWRVFWEATGVEYIADIDEVDRLWLGQSPEQLGLDAVEVKPDEMDESAGSRFSQECAAADRAYRLGREEA